MDKKDDTGTLTYHSKTGRKIKLSCTLQFARLFVYKNDTNGIWQGDRQLYLR